MSLRWFSSLWKWGPLAWEPPAVQNAKEEWELLWDQLCAVHLEGNLLREKEILLKLERCSDLPQTRRREAEEIRRYVDATLAEGNRRRVAEALDLHDRGKVEEAHQILLSVRNDSASNALDRIYHSVNLMSTASQVGDLAAGMEWLGDTFDMALTFVQGMAAENIQELRERGFGDESDMLGERLDRIVGELSKALQDASRDQ